MRRSWLHVDNSRQDNGKKYWGWKVRQWWSWGRVGLEELLFYLSASLFFMNSLYH
jgi:hypothetical protein